MIPICANCGTCTEIIFADSIHSLTDDGKYEEHDGEQYFTVKGWLCIDCVPPEIRELYWPIEKKEMLH